MAPVHGSTRQVHGSTEQYVPGPGGYVLLQIGGSPYSSYRATYHHVVVCTQTGLS
jgi:hypothetical protein